MIKTNEQIINEVTNLLKDKIKPDSLHIYDDSHMHQGHVESMLHGGMHLQLNITSKKLASMNKVEAHRLVYTLLQDYLPAYIHALEIKIQAT